MGLRVGTKKDGGDRACGNARIDSCNAGTLPVCCGVDDARPQLSTPQTAMARQHTRGGEDAQRLLDEARASANVEQKIASLEAAHKANLDLVEARVVRHKMIILLALTDAGSRSGLQVSSMPPMRCVYVHVRRFDA